MAVRYRFFEDYHVGQEGVTSSRTIGESAINTFAYVTGDYAREHLDRHAAATSAYGGRIAHGLLGSSLVPAMISQTAPHIVGQHVPGAFFRGFETNYRRAIPIDDTIRVFWRVSEMSEDPRAEGFGVVVSVFRIVNQDDIELYDGTVSLTVRKEATKQAAMRFDRLVPWEISEFVLDSAKVYYFEDFVVGVGEDTGGRTFTESDIVNFAGLTGDLNRMYLDAVYAKESSFGERLVPSLLAFSALFPLVNRDGDIMKTQANPAAHNWAGHLADGATFLAPVRLGDTLRCRCRIESTRRSRGKPHFGIVRFGLQGINQRNEVTLEGHVTMLAPCGMRAE